MKELKLHTLLKVLFIVFSVLFLLTACGKDEGASGVTTEDQRTAAQMQNTCWQSSFLSMFYKNIGEQTQKVYTDLTKEKLLNVVLLGFTIWMAYQILRHISTPTPESLGEFWTKIVRKAFLCAFCGILASSTEQIYYVINNFIFPIYITLLEFTSEVMERLAKDPDAQVKALKIASNFDDDEDAGAICELYENADWGQSGCSFKSSSMENFDAGHFPEAPLNMLSCMACAVSARLSIGYDIAVRLMKLATVTSFLCGVFLIACFTIAKLCFALYLTDSIFRLNMIMIILPILIMAYPFEQIRKWSVTGFKIILNSSAIMFCLGIIVSMTILAMQKLLTQNGIGLADKSQYETFGATAMALIFMGFLVIKTTGMAVELSDKITGGGGKAGMQRKVQQLVAMAAKAVVHGVTAGTGKIATSIIDHVEKLREARNEYNKLKAKAANVRNRLDNLRGIKR